jgi:hypothetical protein
VPRRDVRHQIIVQRLDRLVRRTEEILDRFFEAGGVRQDSTQRDWLRKIARDFEVEVFPHVLVQVELSLLDQLHHRGRGEQFRNGTGPEESLFRDNWFSLLEIGKPVTLGEKNLAVFDDRHHGAGHVAILDLRIDQAVEEWFQINPRQFRRRRGGRGGLRDGSRWGDRRRRNQRRESRSLRRSCASQQEQR